MNKTPIAGGTRRSHSHPAPRCLVASMKNTAPTDEGPTTKTPVARSAEVETTAFARVSGFSMPVSETPPR